MSDLSTMIKRFFLPVIFSTAVISNTATANTIRITGPTQGVQPATSSLPAATVAPSSADAIRYGPTTSNETLWSIASRYRPNNQISIYQVIGAIFRNNPQAFENSNIHGLIPGSHLVIPTERQMRLEYTDAVKQRLEADQRVSSRSQRRTSAQPQVTAPKPQPAVQAPKPAAPAPKPQEPKPAPTVVAQPEQPTEPMTEVEASEPEAAPKSELIPAKPTALQAQLDASDEQMTKLLESNHLLRVRLAEMQHEVAALKQQVSDDEMLREQIKGFIDQQRAQQAQVVEPQPGLFDRMIANPWMLAALALIPGALIASLLAYFLLGRKREAEDDVKALDAPQSQDETAMVPPPSPAPSDDGVPNLTLDDDDDLDDLFGDEESLFDDPESSLFSQESSLDSKPGGENSGFELGSNLGASSISVNSDDEAIGLEDMERALDEMDSKPEPNPDEELAAMWEQSLQADDDDEDSFDLSYDGDELDFDSPLDPSADGDQIIDQAMLDDLFSSDEDEQPSVASESAPQPEQLVGQAELDALFDSVDVDGAAGNVPSEQDTAEQAAVDKALADIEMMASPAAENDFASMFEQAVDRETDKSADRSTALLDELLEDEDSLTSEIELEEDSTALLDELLDEPEADDLLSNHDIEVAENSTELLDELLADVGEGLDTDDLDIDDFDGDMLDDDIEQQPVALDNIRIEEDSTELLDDILEQHFVPESGEDVERHEENVRESGGGPQQAPFSQEAEKHDDAVLASPEVESTGPEASAGLEASSNDVQSAGLKASTDLDGGAPLATDELPSQDNSDSSAVQEPPQAALAPEPEIDEIEQLLAAADMDSAIRDDRAEIEAIGQTVEQLLESLGNDEQASGDDFDRVEAPGSDELDAVQSPPPATAAEEQAEQSVAAQEERAAESSADFDDEFPVFDEETLLAELDEAPEPEGILQKAAEKMAQDVIDRATLSVDELPEFDEDAAFNDPELEPLQEGEHALDGDDEQAMLDNVVRQLQQAAEAAEKPQPEAIADALSASEQAEPSLAEPASPYSLHGRPDIEFETLDPASLPEFSEDDALQASFDEQYELEQYEREQGIDPQSSPAQEAAAPAEPFSPQPEQQAAEFQESTQPNAQATNIADGPLSEEFVDSAGLDMDALLSDPELQADWERELLVGRPQEVAADTSAADDLSEEEHEIWSASSPEPELEGEDWGEQPEMNIEDVPAFDEDELMADDSAGAESEIYAAEEELEPLSAIDEAASELVTEPQAAEPVKHERPESSYISIDELMKDLDDELLETELDEAPLNLDVGLDEFPDVLSDIGSLDIDSQGEFASKLDLAKAYLEMNDSEGARGLLEQVAQGGDAQLQQEAQALLAKLRN
ncbi:hypothetical protein H744_2c2794 [Photobacterium gaetbulicola Gung47]|uniref:LysM domain-containing protein n=1 Tax=Photobacterium gaetbulicola Gung47 TaxID=658445 RepID=A0A0C5WSR9_9GAMM|nr:FimV/HubP family polar landmark protein [Photobacterium gaetbulicola]AJR09447.1 hypothetical protein H744_2c2794 [Photobacterium gaetbulicola Gung47]